MNPHRGAADLLAERARKHNRPVTVTFQVTDRCNYECVHCYQEHVDRDELSLAEIRRILREIADAGVLFLTLMGGEFFMHPHADEILQYSHELGFAIKLLTTGHHVHERRADLLATLLPLQVDLSLYSAHRHGHEAITQQPGSWQRTCDAARRLIARRVPVLLKAPVMESNAADLSALRALAHSMGAQSTFDAKVTGRENRDQSPVALRMSGATLRTFYRDEDNGVAKFLQKTYAAAGNDKNDKDGASELRPLSHTPCRAGQQAVAINPRGEVWPCNALPMRCGDLRTQTFQAIWQTSPQLREIRDLRWAKISECRHCQLRPYCQRCHGMALLEQGEIYGPSLEACRHAVAVRDALRDAGQIPATETALPPTWSRVDGDGRHDLAGKQPGHTSGMRRSAALRVLD